jgi:hypothetical protein
MKTLRVAPEGFGTVWSAQLEALYLTARAQDLPDLSV